MKLGKRHGSDNADLNALSPQADAVSALRRDGTTQLLKHPGVLAGLLLALALIAACGNSGAFSEAYFEGFETAKARHEAEIRPGSTSPSLAAVAEQLHQSSEALSTFAGDLEALKAPLSVADTHSLAVQLTRERSALWEEIARNFPLTQSELIERRASLQAFSVQLQSNSQQFYEALCDLERAATDEDIAIDLGCGPMEALAMSFVDRDPIQLPTGAVACDQASKPGAEIESGQVTVADWFNLRAEPVRLYRVEAPGERELVTTIAPRGRYLQVPLVGAGLLVTDENDECIGGYHPLPLPGMNIIIPGADE